MSIYIFLFFLLSLSTAQGDCSPKTCSDYGPPIRFPFRLKNHHPQHCGYPGFDLSCSPNNTATVLDLPNSLQVIVTNIDYTSQSIHIKDRNNCFPQLLQNLDLSTTCFQFADTVYTLSLFSCPLAKQGFSYRVTCLCGDGREVYAEDGEDSIYHAYDPPQMLSCGKMYDLSVPIEAFNQSDLQLKWHQRVEVLPIEKPKPPSLVGLCLGVVGKHFEDIIDDSGDIASNFPANIKEVRVTRESRHERLVRLKIGILLLAYQGAIAWWRCHLLIVSTCLY